MARETGKQRSQRIQIDYYRHVGGLQHLKYACVLAALLGAGVYAVYVVAAGGGSHTSTGPLAIVHASFENDCQECHRDFTPIDPRGSKLEWKMVGLSSSISIGHIERACQNCHQVGDHYRDTMNAEGRLADQNCAICHADHKGRVNDLTFVTSQRCVSCHSKLSDVCSAAPKVRSNVSSFARQSHGEFSSLSKGDPGAVKFDHHQHMLPGQVNEGEKGAFTVAMLDQPLRQRYRKQGQTDSSPVTLDCSSCHEMDGDPDRTGALASDRELGRYIKPVSFDEHCSACHSMNPGIATEDTTPLPHAVPWKKIELLLQATIAGTREIGQSRTPRDDTKTTPQPGEGLGKPAPSPRLVASVDVQAARKMVEVQCLQCHDGPSISDEAIAAGLAGTAQPMIPERWLKHGLYDHAAHRRINCRFCHEAAYPVDGPAKPPSDHETVMIAGIDSCQGCHRDAESPTPTEITSQQVKSLFGGQPTWASDTCTLCHRYHGSLSMTDAPAVTAGLAEATP